MSYQFDGEFIEKFYLTFTMLAYESNRRFYPVGEVVGPMDKYKFTRNEVDMLFFLNSCVDKKVKPQNSLRQSYGKGYQTQRGALGVFGSEYKETF